MHLTMRLLANRHPAFIARTVFVKNNDVDDACRLVNRIIGKEGLLEQFRLTRYYEKPFQTRRRINHEKCKAIYNEDMERKIQFVLRKNRHEPLLVFRKSYEGTARARNKECLEKLVGITAHEYSRGIIPKCNIRQKIKYVTVLRKRWTCFRCAEREATDLQIRCQHCLTPPSHLTSTRQIPLKSDYCTFKDSVLYSWRGLYIRYKL